MAFVFICTFAICTAPSDVTCGAGVGAERPREARRALAGARAVVAGPVT